jgi:hypothetical protein
MAIMPATTTSARPGRTDERGARTTEVDEPSGTPPDEDLAYDPEMTEADEANIPLGSDADPKQAED